MDCKGRKGRIWLRKCQASLGIALLLLCLPFGGWAAEFTANMILKDGDKLMPGKIYVKGDKMRHEFLDEQGHTVTIVRKDKKLVWVVLPQDRVYVEMPLNRALPGQFLQVPDNALRKRKICTEIISGYPTERLQVTVPGDAFGPVIQTFWVCDRLGLPLKMECKEKNFSVEYKDIKEGPVADRLFELPTGYRKMTKPPGLL